MMTIEDIKDAYRKLKSYVYYDNTSLLLRQKMAGYEHSIDFEKKLKRLTEALENPELTKSKIYFNNLISRINYHIIPKKIELNEFEKDEFIISNKFQNDIYNVSKVTYLIDADIELHIISVLWILKVGYLLTTVTDKGSSAYKLETELASGKINKGIKLFKPYYKQYQKWRDDGIQAAKDELKKGKSVVIISLDIKDYYHSVRMSFEDLNNLISTLDDSNEYKYLTDLIEQIHIKYSNLFYKVQSKRTLLPIGLLSSGLLANWYLRRFDKKIRNEIKPVYYGRYVDDIFIVVIDTNYKGIIHEITAKNKENKLFDLYIKKYFVNIKNKILDLTENKNKEVVYKAVGYSKLFIQKSKIKLYVFDSNESIAVLNQFEKNIRDNSSEFRFLPEEELVKKKFEDNAYSIIYSDTVNKLRSVEEFKCNKYEASKYLANEIFSSRLWDSDDKHKKDSAKQMLSFFSGRLNLEFHDLWEKIITYFVINNLKREFNYFSQETIKAISKISITDNYVELRKGNKFLLKDEMEEKIKGCLFSYLKIAVAMPVAINLNFVDTQEKIKRKFAFIDIVLARRIRATNLIRHNYVFFPLFNYTKLSRSEKYNLFERNIEHYSISRSENNEFEIAFDERLLEYSPRFVHFHETTVFILNRKIFLDQRDVKKDKNIKENFFNTYIEDAFEIFHKFNYKSNIFSEREKEKLRELYPEVDMKEDYNVVNVFSSNNSETVKNFKARKVDIAVANTIVHEKNLMASINKKPILSKERKDELFKLLNLVTKEKSDMFIMPETSVPYAWLPILAKYSHDHQKAIICGLEHLVAPNKVAYNFIVTILPFEIYGYKSCLVKVRLKNHYSPEEEIILKRKGLIIPRPYRYSYDLFIWNKIYFSCYYCYEIADIRHRDLFKSKVDFLVASVLNRDVNYFSNIIESASRDIHCYFIQVNSSDRGDTRITMPSKTETKDILKLKGGENSTILTAQIDIDELREFQKKDLTLQYNDKEKFKMTPPDFSREWVRKREQGSW